MSSSAAPRDGGAQGRPGPSRRLFRRIDVRLTSWFSVVFLLTSVALFGLTMWNLMRTLRAQDQQALQTRVLGHWARFQAATSEQTGITQLINDIQTESMVFGDRPYLVRIATKTNQDVFVRIPLSEWQYAFDLSSILAGTDPHAGAFITLRSETLGYDLEIISFPLSENYVIQIGMDTELRVRVARIFQTSFLLTFAVLFGVSVLGGLFFTARSLRPIGALNATIQSIIDTGQLDQRIPVVGGGDDLDHMVGSFNHMLDRVEQLVHGMRDALDAVAHDLRTPMTRFRATAESALASEPSAGAYADALGSALEESDQILRMLNSMMDISEAESGAMTLRREEVDLVGLVNEVADVYSMVAEEAGVRLATQTESVVTVQADAGRLRQAVGNLVDNAVKYARPGSVVRLSVAVGPTAEADQPTAELSVRNEGQGIAAEDLPKIWNRLYRGRAGRRTSGLGLGLTLVRAIVEAHGGMVRVESTPGEFANFRIQLPVTATPAPEPVAPA